MSIPISVFLTSLNNYKRGHKFVLSVMLRHKCLTEIITTSYICIFLLLQKIHISTSIQFLLRDKSRSRPLCWQLLLVIASFFKPGTICGVQVTWESSPQRQPIPPGLYILVARMFHPVFYAFCTGRVGQASKSMYIHINKYERYRNKSNTLHLHILAY